ncbi:MAG TPA: hypothetical protein VER98_03075 [Terriglobia bacterium]|nr:hypothetical protein [Terriglobia bacterium]
MSKHIADFLLELSKNPLLAEQFKKDRHQTIAAAGFTGREADLLRISDVGTWRENFTEMRLQNGIEPGGEAFDAEADITMDEPLGQGKTPPKARKKKKVAKKPAKKKPAKKMPAKKMPAKKISKKPAKKKKGGRK